MTSSQPPNRRRPVPQQPTRRPRVAGLRHPDAPHRPDEQQHPVRQEPEQDTQIIPKITDEPERQPTPSPKPRPRPKRQAAAETKQDSPLDVTAEQPIAPWLDEPLADPESSFAEDFAGDEVPARRGVVVPVVLAVVVVLIGGLAAWFGVEWASVRSSAASNTALTDAATTAQLNGQISAAVNQTFSFDYTNLAKTQRAVQQTYTGLALCEYNEVFKQVKQLAPQEKLVLTTTVQKEGVEQLQGDTARVLLLLEQHDTRATDNQTADSQSMMAVNAVRQGGSWKISALDLFNATNPNTTCKS